VLQAIDFLRSAATRDIPEYLRERGWEFADLKSDCIVNKDVPIRFFSVYEFLIDEKAETVEWDFSVDYIDGKWKIDEKLRVNNQVTPKLEDLLVRFDIQSSVLKITKFEENGISQLQQFLMASKSYELLSTDRIRLGKKRVDVSNIGIGGENLAHYIHKCMTEEQRQKLNSLVSQFVDFKVEIKTYDSGKNILLFLADHSVNAEIDSQHISDGLLRIIAFATIVIQNEALTASGIIMLDEIEDGIDPFSIEKVIASLRKLVTDAKRQIIITTHSPIIADYVEPDEIIYLWKNGNGAIHGEKMFETESMRESLSFLNPGEIWYNYGKDEIISRLSNPHKEALRA
jgi:hypothetical protein